MPQSPSSKLGAVQPAGDADLVARVSRKDHVAFEALMRRYNGRLFRVARSILKNDAEAEDALQEAYLEVYRHIAQFRGGSQLSTWLTRIVINQALMRVRKEKRDRVVLSFGRRQSGAVHEPEAGMPDINEVADERVESPGESAVRGEIRRILERRIDELPVTFRTVFVMREVEEMSVEETAECLSIPEATVRTRLFRARALLRAALSRDLDLAAGDAFSFAGERCDRIVAGVLSRVDKLQPLPTTDLLSGG
jgi:RNA polymerase sigma-70 factor (ECF subfamily)